MKNAGLQCKHDGCTDDAVCKGYCTKHYQRWSSYGDSSIVHIGGTRRGSRILANWKGDLASYSSMHKRVDHFRGRAKNNGPCVDADIDECHGRLEWSNNSGDYGDIDDFSVRCTHHHRTFDVSGNGPSWEDWVNGLEPGSEVIGPMGSKWVA
jgi:hypothetical protein